MNYAIIFRLLAVIQMALVLALSASFTVGLLLPVGEGEGFAVQGLEIAAGISLALAGLFLWLGRRGRTAIFHKEALAVIGLGWLLASAVGAIPYLLTVEGLGFPSAFFESASGFTTTGASVFAAVDELPAALLFWRALTQWIGGLGVVVFFVAILSFLGSGAKVLFSREYSGSSEDAHDGRMQTGALRIMLLYLLISGLCASAYRIAGLGWFDAVCHMFTTVSTGGFGTLPDSLGAFEKPAVEWVAVFFMGLCGVSFLLLLRVMRGGGLRALTGDVEAKTYFGLLVGGSAMAGFFLLAQGADDSLHETVRAAVFQTTSILTTTGFSTADFAVWAYPAQILLVLLMIVGGCSGSTAGGVKVIRLAAGFRTVVNHLEQAFRPHVVRPIRINRRTLSQKATGDIAVFLVLAGMVAVASVLVVSVFEPDLDPVSTVSAVVASLFNIGPGLGAVGPTENFGFLADHTKVYLALLMIMGRLEFFAVLVLFAPSLWKRFS